MVEALESGLQNAPIQSPAVPPPLDFPETRHDEAAAAAAESEWVISIKKKLKNGEIEEAAAAWEKHSIYRIPLGLRDSDDKAYIPQIVSLGPYHHDRKRFISMERHKWRALRRTGHHIERYLDAVRGVEARARACYEGHIKFSSKKFVEILVLDSCFALDVFRGATDGFEVLGYSRNDPVFTKRGVMHAIKHDMIMLENQIPLFVLDEINQIQSPGDSAGAVAKLANHFFDSLIPTRGDESYQEVEEADQGRLHCLDVFRCKLLPSRRVVNQRSQTLIYCVTELKEAGIIFRKKETGRFWDIDFSNGILKLPCLEVQDGTKSMFLNLMAFEQCHPGCRHDITSYIVFMDNLIDSPADVSYLKHRGIIKSRLGSDAEVAELFNRLCQKVVFDDKDSLMSTLSEKVNRYYSRTWPKWRASLTHKYFNNPWSIISLFAAVVLLVLTLAQTFFSAYAHYIGP